MASRKKLSTTALTRCSTILHCIVALTDLVITDLPASHCAQTISARTLLRQNAIDLDDALAQIVQKEKKKPTPRPKRQVEPATVPVETL